MLMLSACILYTYGYSITALEARLGHPFIYTVDKDGEFGNKAGGY